jgi:uncharacterized membrane protein YhaH (DUF805 family)
MDFQELFLSTSGRISRKTWWIGTVILIVASIVLYLILGFVGLGMTSSWGPVIAFVILVYPALAIGIKRRQDRDNNGMDYKIMMGISGVMTVLQALGIGYSRVDLGNGMVAMAPDMWMGAIQLVFGIFAIYVLIQLGFLKGTPGPNSYGPDPLGYATA